MKKFSKECKHAQFEREHKMYYTEEEKTGGCWTCGKELTLEKKRKHTDLGAIHMTDEDREEVEKDPEKFAELLAWMNEPRYVCLPCQKEKLDKASLEFEEHPENFHVLNNVEACVDRIKESTRELIKEIEECGPDCPYWHRLEKLREKANE